MKAVTWQGKRDVRVEDVPDPQLQEPTDAIVKITTTNICGSDLHLYETLGPFMDAGDVMGHEPMGIVEEVGSEAGDLKGWYCNITKPAVVTEDELTFVDLALDLWVWPDMRYLVLDEDEFDELAASTYSPEDTATARAVTSQTAGAWASAAGTMSSKTREPDALPKPTATATPVTSTQGMLFDKVALRTSLRAASKPKTTSRP